MKPIKPLYITLLMLLSAAGAKAQATDSVDVLHYDISLDLSQGAPFTGDATLTVRLTRPCATLALGLFGTADSLWVAGTKVEPPQLGAVPVEEMAAGQEFSIRVCYHSNGYVESYGWGGFHFDNDMSYSLGVGFNEDPHLMGRAIMPCRDNFHDKATYRLRLLTRAGWTAECSGMLQSRTVRDDGCEQSEWLLGQEASTYLVGVSQAPWKRIRRQVSSLYADYPLTLAYLYPDSARVARAFAALDSVVPGFERCFGPYRWGRIGYIATLNGSMEHANNIALDRSFMGSTSERAQMTIAHELGHAWFGNLITCATEGDMWINEGGASFCSEVAMEATSGRAASNRYYQTNLESVLRTTHLTDGGYRALHDMPHSHTYGSTTYDKGALVWHSLRGYLGDSLFYHSLRRLMDSKAFGNVDAAQVRDSMSLYSGVDLADFFQFHVFTPGFVDYHVSMSPGDGPTQVVISIDQQGVGTTEEVRSNRVPVSFFGFDGQQCKRWVAFDGASVSQVLDLPFAPAYCVLDHDMELSDAATLADLKLGGSNQRFLHAAHVRLAPLTPQPEGRRVMVEHHWGEPRGAAATEGVRRTAMRYWVVRSAQGYLDGVQGQFRYVREGYTGGDYPHLDPALYTRPASLDSMVVLYRPHADSQWVAWSHVRSGNDNEGYFLVDNLCTGEYTLAVVDTARMGLPAVRDAGAQLFPNPVPAGAELTVSLATDRPFTLAIFDADGRRVWQQKDCRSGKKLRPRLAAGTYFVRIENKVVSLQSKLIVL